MPATSWASSVPSARPRTPACRSRSALTTPSWSSLAIRRRSAPTSMPCSADRSSKSSIALAACAANVEARLMSAGTNGGDSTVRATTSTPRALPICASGEAISGPTPVAAAKARPAGGISSASRATMFVAFVSATSVSVSRTGMTWPTLSGPTLRPATPRNVISPASDTVTTTPETASTRTRASLAIRPRSCSRSSPSRTAWVSAPIAWTSRSTRREGRALCRPMMPPRRGPQCTHGAKRSRLGR